MSSSSQRPRPFIQPLFLEAFNSVCRGMAVANSLQGSLDFRQNCRKRQAGPSFPRLQEDRNRPGIPAFIPHILTLWRLKNGTWTSAVDGRHSAADHSVDLAVWRIELTRSLTADRAASNGGRPFAVRWRERALAGAFTGCAWRPLRSPVRACGSGATTRRGTRPASLR